MRTLRSFWAGCLVALAMGSVAADATVGVNASRKDTAMNEISPLLRAAASPFLNADSTSWWPRNVTRSYALTGASEVCWLIDSDDQSAILARVNGDWKPLTGSKGLPLASDLLGQTHGPRPWEAMGEERFARLLVSWFSDPRSYVLNEAFFRRQASVLSSWLAGTEKSPQAFESLRQEVDLRVGETGYTWRLNARMINRQGGVEDWRIDGTLNPFQIANMQRTPVKPAGTFYFPDEL